MARLTLTKPEVRKLQEDLSRIAWPLKADGLYGPTTAMTVRKFQAGFAALGSAGVGGKPLPVNGAPTRRTLPAIAWSAANNGRCSKHFRYLEFASKGNGDVQILLALILALEDLREIVGKPLPIISGYRDPWHNQKVGGAKFSQHLYGCASDLPESRGITIAQATEAGFSGIGYDEDNRFVEHADVRHAGPNNTTGGRPGSPTTWRYS